MTLNVAIYEQKSKKTEKTHRYSNPLSAIILSDIVLNVMASASAIKNNFAMDKL
jgi:hypothetical protein